MSEVAVIRRATAADVAAMLPVIRAHARFERTSATAHSEALRSALSGPAPVLHAWVAVTGEIIGYATATLNYSTFAGDRFVHLDCLFVDGDHRGAGVGARLLTAVRDHAAAAGIGALQWQTPAWNEDAHRFYRRSGAAALSKLRSSPPIGDTSARSVVNDLGGNLGA